jgi:hypothetical protein
VGGGLACDLAATVEVDTSVLSSNTADAGGGMAVTGTSVLDFIDSSLTTNHATELGGGVSITKNSRVRWRDGSRAMGNEAMQGAGGHVADSESTLTCESGSFTANTASVRGGGIALSEGARLELDACRLSTNTAPRGGGMWIAGPGSHMTRTDAAVVTENAARAGAGIFADQPSDLDNVETLPVGSDGVATRGVRVILATAVPSLSPAVLSPFDLHVVDALDNVATADDETTCELVITSSEIGVVVTGKASTAQAGVLTFADFAISATVGSNHSIAFECTSPAQLAEGATVGKRFDSVPPPWTLQMGPCPAGSALQGSVCGMCEVNTYSTSGVSCLPCPPGAECKREVPCANVSQSSALCRGGVVAVGIHLPVALPGYWAAQAPASLRDTCDATVLRDWHSGKCVIGDMWDTETLSCVSTGWSAAKLYRCAEDQSFYQCPLGDKTCPGGEKSPCAQGALGPMCSVCVEGWYRAPTRQCMPCVAPSAMDSVTLAAERVNHTYYIMAAVGIILLLAILHLAGVLSKIGRMIKRKWSRWQPKRNVGLSVSTETAKSCLTFMQILATLQVSNAVQWPSSVQAVLSRLVVSNLDLLSVFSAECAVSITFYDRLRTQLLLPILAFALMVFVSVSQRKRVTHRLKALKRSCVMCGKEVPGQKPGSLSFPASSHTLRHKECDGDGEDALVDTVRHNIAIWRARVAERLSWEAFSGRIVRSSVALLVVSYLPISNAILDFLRCIEVGEKFYLEADMALECYTTTWFSVLAITVLAGGVFVLGVPFGALALLWRVRNYDVSRRVKALVALPAYDPERVRVLKAVRSSCRATGRLFVFPLTNEDCAVVLRDHFKRENLALQTTRERLGVLYEHMRPDRWWWEGVEMTRRLAFSAAVFFVAPGTPVGLVMTFVVALAYLFATCLASPFKETGVNALSVISQAVVSLMLLAGLLITLRVPLLNRHYDPLEEGTFIGRVIIAAMVCVVVCAVVVTIQETKRHRAKVARDKALVETRLQAVPLAEAALRTDVDPKQAAVIESVHTRKLDWPELNALRAVLRDVDVDNTGECDQDGMIDLGRRLREPLDVRELSALATYVSAKRPAAIPMEELVAFWPKVEAAAATTVKAKPDSRSEGETTDTEKRVLVESECPVSHSGSGSVSVPYAGVPTPSELTRSALELEIVMDEEEVKVVKTVAVVSDTDVEGEGEGSRSVRLDSV